MRLDGLLAGLEGVTLDGDPATAITAVTHDSRAVVPGTLFCCVRGATTDGHDHAPEAVRSGAVALLCERPLGLGVAEAVVADVRGSMGGAAAAFHGHPSRSLDVVGVTGTNGKTTVTHLLAAVLREAGRTTEVIGTLSGTRTTPEATELQARLAACRDAGVAAVAMEVSSHALALDRVEGTEFAVAVFTNLSRDHLDFHASMDDYFAAKARLFLPGRTAVAVVNVDDPRGRLLLDTLHVPARTYSLADVTDLDVGFERSTATWRGRRMVVPMGGAFNVSNALAAATVACELGVDPDSVVAGLAGAPPVPGRFEVIRAPGAPAVVVDYAHTPDGIEQVLLAVRRMGPGRLVIVFGCGGDRDREKRPAMGSAASRLADEVVVTSDNPRHEDPLAIIEAVVGGVDGPASLTVEPDRRAAIAGALAGAGPSDIVVVAGKGHETTQTLGEEVLDFDDRVVVGEELARLGYEGPQP